MGMHILLVEDHPWIRELTVKQLLKEKDVAEVRVTTNGEAAIAAIEKAKPDIVLMDIEMPGEINGIEATRRILAKYPDVKIIVLSDYKQPNYIRSMIQLGVWGYLKKDRSSKELIHHIRKVYKGEIVYSHSVKDLVADSTIRDWRGTQLPNLDLLSLREIEVLKLIASGYNIKEICSILEIALKTAESHRRNLKNKLGIQSEALLAIFAMKENLINPENLEYR